MRARGLFAALSLLALAACDASRLAPRETGTLPQARPAAMGGAGAAGRETPSAASLALAQYYRRVQADLLARGLLRTDGGGPDTPITDTMLARDFENIALTEEYVRGAGLRPGDGGLGRIKKWTKPVRVVAEFGPSVPAEQRSADRAALARFTDRLARATGHRIGMSAAGANFHVLFMGEDDRALIQPRIRALVPDVDQASLAIFDRLPRDIHCLVIAFADRPGGYSYDRAIAVIRAEHPDLLRRACIHEEMAQGLGLANDSPQARPSIFNDDDEFALLTTHDEYLLRILYDPRLTPGMRAEEARPIVRSLAEQLVGGSS
ncbi:DUF2927 domain-containing protein [Aestuariicoccus sp. MJ-SS9]|uniref:DUF2927 domain-containing protein n=1 Tax=Aestuariicoccus sp. MJ-SS9 TaxID=3079855 RepID=UPI0029086635|nr:DUF2927 domain-containing protein [Aestuariicoccus sp. MJ-SS9]MDU8909847.1 DUF2927 domain-containing protein [Aestuariicoccus sp. MJ-SS9]